MTVPIETSSANTTLTVDVLRVAIITKCNNVKFGDYQCNNAMALSKLFKLDTENKYQTAGTSISPKDIALKILEHVPANNLIESASAAVGDLIRILFASMLRICVVCIACIAQWVYQHQIQIRCH